MPSCAFKKCYNNPRNKKGRDISFHSAIFGSFLFDPIKLDFDVNVTDQGYTEKPNVQSTHNLFLRTYKAKNSTVNKTEPWRKIFKYNQPVDVAIVRSETEGKVSMVETTEVTIPDETGVTTNVPVTAVSKNAVEPYSSVKIFKAINKTGRKTDHHTDLLKTVLKDQSFDKNLSKEDKKNDFKKIESKLVEQLAVFRSRTEDYSDDREVNTISDLPL